MEEVTLSGSTATVNLKSNRSLYYISSTLSGSKSIQFNLNNLNPLPNSPWTYTFELYVYANTGTNLTFPVNVKWANGETPSIDDTAHYVYVFRTWNGGSFWIGNLQGWWA